MTLASCVTALLCMPAVAAAIPATDCSLRQQDPKTQQPQDKKAQNAILDAEREELRMKDVEAWKKLKVPSLDQVVDVKKSTQPLELPPSATEEIKTKMTDLMQRARDGRGGARTGRSLRELEAMGYPALVFIVNALRDIDYKDSDDAMFGMQLNTSLQNMTMGINTGYVPVEVGVAMDPRKAQWNAMTVPQWLQAVRVQWPTQEKFDDFLKKRRAKKDAELEGRTDDGKDPKDGKRDEPAKGKEAPTPVPGKK